MTLKEVIFFVIAIAVFASVVCLLFNKFKNTKMKKIKSEKKVENVEVNKEEVVNQNTVEHENKKENKVEVPTVSIALQDELNDFKNYLKSRIAPKENDEPNLHPYETPKVNRFDSDFDDFYKSNKFDNFDEINDVEFNRIPYDEGLFGKSDMDDELGDFSFPRIRKKDKEIDFQNLPEKVKILLFTDIFKNRFL